MLITKKKNNINLFINTSSLAKFHFINNNNLQNGNKNCKTRNNIHKNYNKNFHSGANSNTNKKTKNLSQSKLLRLLSYSPNKILTQYLYHQQCDSNSRTTKNSVKKNINKNFNAIFNINSHSPSNSQNRASHKKMKNKINYTVNNSISKELKYIMNKGDDLIKRSKNLLNNYIMLSYQIKEQNIKGN